MNRIITEDNVTYLSSLPENFVNLTVTSPPYDNLRNYQGYELDFGKLVKELYRITTHGGVVVWVVGDATVKGSETGSSFKQALQFIETGFNLHDTMIYHKENPTPSKSNRYQQSFEYMFVFSKGKPSTFNPLVTEKKYIENRKKKQYNKRVDGEQIVREYRSETNTRVLRNIWSYTVGLNNTSNDRIAFKHPAIFPEKLAEDHIKSWSNPGDVVLDPFGGSGTTAKMALLNLRNYIHVDVSSDYNDIAKERIKAAELSLLSDCVWSSDYTVDGDSFSLYRDEDNSVDLTVSIESGDITSIELSDD